MLLRFYLMTIKKRLLPLLLACMTLAPALLMGAEPSTRPFLRIDGEMHHKAVLRIAADRSRSFVVSASLDKTIRIWQLPSGTLRKTIRVPIAPGAEGELTAVAVTPEGGLIAAGGVTGKTWERSRSYVIYVFDTATGRMSARLSGLKAPAKHVAISGDGRFLAVVMAGQAGLRVYSILDGRLLRSDDNYGKSATWVDFDREGRLVTVSLDGFIRLYDSRFVLKRKKRIAAEYKPYSAVFSPDGEKIAVGFSSRPAVAVFSAQDLSLLYFPDASGAVGDFRTVAWSLDGQLLYGAGSHNNEKQRMIRSWPNGGQPDLTTGIGVFTDIPATISTISHIIPAKDGGVMFAGAAPVIGALDDNGFYLFRRSKPTANFLSWHKNLLISHDGSVIAFSLDGLDGKGMRFSAPDLEWGAAVVDAPGLLPPVLKSRLIFVTGLQGRYGKLRFMGKKPLSLSYGERANAIAVARDDSFFVVGTSNNIRLYDSRGQERWVTAVSTPVRGLNISGNGRVVIAAHTDGTVRWYRVAGGGHFLSLFAHRDKKRWIAWTPDRFFAASKGGDGILGWHINQGRDKSARFIPAAKIRKTNHNPAKIKGLFNKR